MFPVRRVVPIVAILLFAGVLMAADKDLTGTIDKVDGKFKSIWVKLEKSKDKNSKLFEVTDKIDITNEKGDKIGLKELERAVGKDVTLTVSEALKNNKIETTLKSIQLGKAKDKKDDKDKKGDKATAKSDDMKKDDAKMADKPKTEASKGTEYTIVSVNLEKNEIVVDSSGTQSTIKVDSNTKFIGPRGGDRGEGKAALTDSENTKILSAGYKIRVVVERGKVKEIHLPYANSLKKDN